MSNEQILEKIIKFITTSDENAALLIQLIENKFNINRWLSSQDVKTTYKLSESTLFRIRKKGRIPFAKLGGTFYYQSDKIEEMMLQEANKSINPTLS
jgi:hypothetical protein